MINIQTQAEFIELVTTTPTNQLVRLFPRQDGRAYELNTQWYLPAGARIVGIHRPEIRFTGSVVGGWRAMIRVTNVDRVHIRGLVLTASGVTGELYGIHIEECGEGRLSGHTSATASRYDDSTTGAQTAIPGIVVRDCEIHSLPGTGIYTYLTRNFHLSNNTVRDTGGSGIHMTSSRIGLVVGNTLERNGRNGMRVEGLTDSSVYDNRIADSALSGMQIGGADRHATYYGNDITGSGADGIDINGAEYLSLSGNTVRSNLEHGLHVATGKGLSLSGNTALENGKSGLRGDTMTYTSLGGNVSRGNTNGINIAGSSNSVTGNNLRGNTPYSGLSLGSANSVGIGNSMAGNANNLEITGSGSQVPGTHNQF